MINVVKGLWRSSKETEWERCINRYWHLDSVQTNLEAERRMENLNPQVFEKYNAEQFYDLLANQRSGYYRWKFGAQQADGNLKALQTFKQLPNNAAGGEFNRIKEDLLTFDHHDIRQGLEIVKQFPGMQDKAGLGFLSVLFKPDFGTVDKWVIKILQHLDQFDFPTMNVTVGKIDPDHPTTDEVVQIIQIFREKASELNQQFASKKWTPRRIDMALFSLKDAI